MSGWKLVTIIFLLGASISNACETNLVRVDFYGKVSSLWVEIADNDLKRSKGLMFREFLPKDNGMLFVYEKPQKVSFWMKNTEISLDMVFIDEDWYIVKIVENTQPLSFDLIHSETEIKFVLEVNSGSAKRLKLDEGRLLFEFKDLDLHQFPCQN